MAIDIGLHMAKALGLARQGLAVVQIGVVVDLVEGFELDAKALVVIQHRMVVVGHAPGAGVEVIALGKAHFLACSIEFSKLVTAAQRPAAATGAALKFEQLHLVARSAQFNGGHHARQACAQHQNAGAGLGIAQFDGAVVVRFSGIAQRAHGLVHGTAARHFPDHGKQLSAAEMLAWLWHLRFPF